jgi:hypothetical protein
VFILLETEFGRASVPSLEMAGFLLFFERMNYIDQKEQVFRAHLCSVIMVLTSFFQKRFISYQIASGITRRNQSISHGPILVLEEVNISFFLSFFSISRFFCLNFPSSFHNLDDHSFILMAISMIYVYFLALVLQACLP